MSSTGAFLNSRSEILIRTFPSLRGRLVSAGSFSAASPTAKTTTGTARVPFYVVADATDLRLAFIHRFNSETPNFRDSIPASDLVGVKASLEIGGTIYPLTVNGQLVFNVAAGGVVQTDPLPVEVTSGTIVFVRTFMPSGMTWYYNRYTSTAGSGSGGFTSTTDLTAQGSGAITDAANLTLWTAQSITGTHLNSRKPVALVVGDSIANGAGDACALGTSYLGINTGTLASLIGGGYLVRACRTAGVPVVNAAVSGDTASLFVTALNRWQRGSVAPDVSNVLCEYGRNDISSGGATLAIVQASLISAWLLFYRRGAQVFQATITPRTTSTDGWITTVNQASSSNESVRLLVNGWLRDGAPMTTAFSPVATGSSAPGTIRAGSAGHPLSAYFEVADITEASRDSGIWIPPTNLRTVTGATTTAGGFNVTTATPQFTSADLGRKFVIPGAGTAGGLYVGQTQTFNSTTSVTLSTSTPTAVSAISISVCDNNTLDGLHPGPFVHALMAAAVPTGLFIP